MEGALYICSLETLTNCNKKLERIIGTIVKNSVLWGCILNDIPYPAQAFSDGGSSLDISSRWQPGKLAPQGHLGIPRPSQGRHGVPHLEIQSFNFFTIIKLSKEFHIPLLNYFYGTLLFICLYPVNRAH